MTSITSYTRRAATALAAGALALAMAVPAFASTQESTSTASITFSGGDLILVSADSIVFEPGTVTPIDTEYDATNEVNILISDNRGSEDGWQLTAELGAFTIEGTEVLQNATITVSDIRVSKTNTDNPSAAPILPDSLTLVAANGSAAPVATANSGQGAGGWKVTFNQAGIELAVKADTARAGVATARIDWVIADGV